MHPPLFMLPCFFNWKGDRATSVILLNDIMDLHMPNLDTLVAQGLSTTRRQFTEVYLTHDVVFC